MVRVPCCEMMGMKKGPWTTEEDQKLISYVERYGHENWRALPKQAGLLRCGKSCRLRWINYLRPDIKRGNFSREEEDTIVQWHQLLGNRWSEIAAKLAGRTDNEIKNLWHTRLKKRGKENYQKKLQDCNLHKEEPNYLKSFIESSPASPSTSETDKISNVDGKMEMNMKSSSSSGERSTEIEESIWLEALLSCEPISLTMDDRTMWTSPASSSASLEDPFSSFWPSTRKEDEVEFWLKVFMEPGEVSRRTVEILEQ